MNRHRCLSGIEWRYYTNKDIFMNIVCQQFVRYGILKAKDQAAGIAGEPGF